jgi:hypothetical protein
VSEVAVSNCAFELIFAFDEVISLGNKEKLNIAQVKQLLVMDSQEERMADAEQRNKEREAEVERERRRKEMEAQRAEEARRGGGSGSQLGRGGGFGSMSSSSMGPGRGISAAPQIERSRPSSASIQAPTSGPARKGLSLTSTAPKASEYMDTLKQEMGGAAASTSEMKEMIRQSSSPAASAAGAPASSAHTPPASMRDDVHIAVSEKLLIKLDKDGNVQHFEVRGELDVFVTKEQYQQVTIRLDPKSVAQGLDWKIHPTLNKPKFLENATIQMRDASKAFVINSPNGILKWRLLSQDSSRLPLLVNCWPSAGGGPVAVVNMEYEARKGLELHDVLVKIPIVAKGQPNITGSTGETFYDVKNSILEWSLPLVDSSNLTGTLDFELDQWRNNDTSHLFPINVKFTSPNSLCELGVLQVLLGDQPVKFSSHTVVTVESYIIE